MTEVHGGAMVRHEKVTKIAEDNHVLNRVKGDLSFKISALDTIHQFTS